MKEFYFVVFIQSILFKVLFNIIGIELPVNLTVFLAPAGLLIIWYELAKKNFVFSDTSIILPISSLFLFWGWMIVTVFYSSSVTFKFIKSGLFFLNIFIFIYPIFVELNYKRFIKIFIIVASILEPILFLLIPFLLFGGLEGSRSYYLALGETSGVILLLLLVVVQKGFIKYSFSWLLISMLHLVILISNPARGAIVFTVFIFLVWTFIYFYKFLNPKLFLIILLFLIVGSIIVYQFFNYFPQYAQFIVIRMKKLFEAFFVENNSLIEVSTFERFEFWKYAINMFYSNGLKHFIFGYGIGSFGVLITGFDGRKYPHNLFLETGFELGIIGLFLLALFLWIVLFYIVKKRNAIMFFPIGLIFLDAMKSYSLPDHRLFFAFLAIALTINFKNTETERLNERK